MWNFRGTSTRILQLLASITTAQVIAVCNNTSVTHPMSLVAARKQFYADQILLQNAKKTLASYYEGGAYESDVTKLCDQALEYFTNYIIQQSNQPNNYAIVFDIDETALTDYQLFKSHNFEWDLEHDVLPYRIGEKSVAIKPVLNFSQQLKVLGYKIIFLSGRRASIFNETKNTLLREGFVFDELVLLPMDLFEKKAKTGPWKASVRKTLSAHYHLVGSIGDLESDFEGDCCGYKVKLPNYLY